MTTLYDHIESWLPGNSLTEKVNTFFTDFEESHTWLIKRDGAKKALVEYLFGAPSSIDMPHYNDDIIALCRKDLHPQNDDAGILDFWYTWVAQALLALRAFLNERVTISAIANRNTGYYFSRKSMKVFGQRRSDFRIYKTSDPDVVKTSAPSYDSDRRYMGDTIAYWRKTANMRYTQDDNFTEER